MLFRGDGGCDHIGIFSNNADRLLRFYCRDIGFVVEKEEILSPSLMRSIFGISCACRLIKLRLAGNSSQGGGSASVSLEIFQPAGTKVARRKNATAGYNHWGFRVGDRRKFVRVLQKKKVPVTEVKREGRSIFFVRDPDGNRIEVRE